MRNVGFKLWLLVLASTLLLSCRSETQSNSNNISPPAQPSPLKKAELKVMSKAFAEGGMIPKDYTCDGANHSPPLAWDSAPEGTQSFALIVDDPDAPGQTWVHWVAFNIPAKARELSENVAAGDAFNGSGRQGTNDFKKPGYGGPCPPSGAHRYYFHLYALNTELALDSSATKDQLLKAMENHVLAEGELMGKYQR
ncbi:MAG TPA: YbhB/YbcL family Raf kinase inhibitor-like protein [Pyrinomonadaceae bacterium]|nr:YbhB/YbcL family Raf kinase inhibitor-like protein [Pyrinomonadaceae bacterium]